MDDYYAGAAGARRLITELDVFLQDLVNNIEWAEQMTCVIQLRVKGGDLVSLNRCYLPVHTMPAETETTQRLHS